MVCVSVCFSTMNDINFFAQCNRYTVSCDCNKKNCFYSLEIFPFQKHFRLPNIDTLQYSREKKIKWQNEWNARFKLTICIHLRFLLVKCKCIRCNFRGLILEIFFFLSRVFLSIEIYIFPIETFIKSHFITEFFFFFFWLVDSIQWILFTLREKKNWISILYKKSSSIWSGRNDLLNTEEKDRMNEWIS